jgi:hypothetical protein
VDGKAGGDGCYAGCLIELRVWVTDVLDCVQELGKKPKTGCVKVNVSVHRTHIAELELYINLMDT